MTVPAHDQAVTHHYLMRDPDHHFPWPQQQYY
jgi:hypothetical protein